MEELKNSLFFTPRLPRIPADTEWLRNPGHCQTPVSGINCRTGRKFQILCDELIAPLIKRLNENGIITYFSCQGGLRKNGKNALAYVVFRAQSPKYLAYAVQIIEEFWHDRYLTVRLDEFGRISVYAYETKERFEMSCKYHKPGEPGF